MHHTQAKFQTKANLIELFTQMTPATWQELVQAGGNQQTVIGLINTQLQARIIENGAGEAKNETSSKKQATKEWKALINGKPWKEMLKLWLETTNYGNSNFFYHREEDKTWETTVGGVLVGQMLAKTLAVMPEASFFRRAVEELSKRVISKDKGRLQQQAKQVAMSALDEVLRETQGMIEPYLVVPQTKHSPWNNWPLLAAITKSQVTEKQYLYMDVINQLYRWQQIQPQSNWQQMTPDGQTKAFWAGMAFLLTGGAGPLAGGNVSFEAAIFQKNNPKKRTDDLTFSPKALDQIEQWTDYLSPAFIKRFIAFLDIKTYKGSPNKCRGLVNLLSFMEMYHYGTAEDHTKVQEAIIHQFEQLHNIRGITGPSLTRGKQNEGWQEVYYQAYADKTEKPKDFSNTVQTWLMMAGQRGLEITHLIQLLELAISRQWQTESKLTVTNTYREITKNARYFANPEAKQKLKTAMLAFEIHNATELGGEEPKKTKLRI